MMILTPAQMIAKLAGQMQRGLITKSEYRRECELIILRHFGPE